MYRQPPSTTRTAPLFPYTTLFRSPDPRAARRAASVRFLASAQQREEFGDVDVAAFVGEDAEHRTRARHDLAHHWGRGPARGALARTIGVAPGLVDHHERSEEHTSELQSLMRISYAVFCLKKKNKKTHNLNHSLHTI